MLKSIKRQNRLRDLVNDLERGSYINWSDWKIGELHNLCKFYIDNKICKKIDDQAKQYREFYFKVLEVNSARGRMLNDIINHSPGLKQYLQIHSVFEIGAKNKDWLNLEMISILSVSEKDIEEAHKKEFVPQIILDKLKMFDPEPAGFEVDPVRIEYDLWGRNGPIAVIDTDWEKIRGIEINMTDFLSHFTPIESTSVTRSVGYDDYDLPF